MSNFPTSSVDAVEELRQLRRRVMTQFEEGEAPFWSEILDLSSHEFKVRVDQRLQGMGFSGNNWYWLMAKAIADYQTYWVMMEDQ